MKSAHGIIFTLTLFFSLLSAAQGGNLVGNSGDPFVTDFRKVAETLVDAYGKGTLKHRLINPAELRKAVAETVVSSQDNLVFWDNNLNSFVEADAINYFPQRKWIEISRSRWKPITPDNKYEKYKWILHQYLIIIGVPDENNEISAQNYWHIPPVQIIIVPSF